MSSKDTEDKVCEEKNKPQLDGKGVTNETSAGENGAQVDSGEAAKGPNISEKVTAEHEKTQIGAHHPKKKNKDVFKGPDLTEPNPKRGDDVQFPAQEPPKNGWNNYRLAPGGAQRLKPTQSSYLLAVGFFLALAVACIAVAIYIGPPENDTKSDFDLAKVFENGLDELRSSFTNQTDRFWKILRSRGLAHLRKKYPSQPLVFLLAAPPAAHEWVDCLGIKLAEMLDPRHKRNLVTIDGEKEEANSPDETKKEMDNLLKEKFGAGHRVALIQHLELLPPPSPFLFYSYCDDQTAPNKHVAVIFTVHMPVEPSQSLSPKEAEGSVEKYLSGEVWAKEEKDAVAALLSRIADTVVLMNGESSGFLKTLCSYSTD